MSKQEDRIAALVRAGEVGTIAAVIRAVGQLFKREGFKFRH